MGDKLYLLEFIFTKTLRITIPTTFWVAVFAIPVLLAQLGVLDFALIAGRCYRPLGRCGQDNVSLVAFGLGALLAVPAIVATVFSLNWANAEWTQERADLKRKREQTEPTEPNRPNIYD